MGGSIGDIVSAPGKILGGVSNTLGGVSVGQSGPANIDYGAFDPNAKEQSLTDALIARANGQGVSAAEQQMQNGIGQAQRAGASAAVSARGVNPALAARLAQQTQTNLATQGVGQTSALRAQEQATATGQAQNALADQRAARVAAQQLNVQNVTGANTLASNNANAAANRQSNLISGIGQAGTMAAAAISDENAKTNIHSGGAKIQDFLDAISAEEYNYKNPSQPGAGEGSYVSPMAQDLEKTPIGSQMVMDTPQGKMVDYGKGMGAMLAAQAHLNERLNKMEGAQKLAYGGFAEGVSNAVAATKGSVGSDLKAMESKGDDKKKDDSNPQIGDTNGGSGTQLGSAGDAMGWMNASSGAMVPGEAKVAGDHPSNDTVNAKLSPGELVVPRTVVQGGPDAIRAFAEALLEKEKVA